MRISYVSIFPEIFVSFLATSLLAKGLDRGHITVEIVNPRDFTHDPHRQVDDVPYGGGAGMLLKAQPYIDALASCVATGPSGESIRRRIVWVGPSHHTFTQCDAHDWSVCDHIVFLCGRYEGVDERVALWCRDRFGDEFVKVSLGRFVTLGGELPAMTMTESVVRLLPSFIGDAESWRHESYRIDEQMNTLEHPHYTRPEIVEGYQVPPVLLSGHHAQIAQWRDDNTETIDQH